jgi:hypothetical protein
MKKIYMALILGLVSVSLMGCGDPCKEDALTKIGDSIAVIGKTGLEKDKVLAERAASRAAKCAEKTGGDLKKSLGF